MIDVYESQEERARAALAGKALRTDAKFIQPQQVKRRRSVAKKFVAAWVALLRVVMGTTGKGYQKIKQYGTGANEKLPEGSGRAVRRKRQRIRDRSIQKVGGYQKRYTHGWSAFFDGNRPTKGAPSNAAKRARRSA